MKRQHHYLNQAECDRIRRLCEVHTQTVVAEIVGVNVNAITRLKRRGWKAYTQAHRYRPMPNDFPFVCETMSLVALCKHYGTHQAAVYRWSEQVGRKHMPKAGGAPPKPRPSKADLAGKIASLGVMGAARHYGVDRNTLSRWREFHGLPMVNWAERRKKARANNDNHHWVERYVAERRKA